jgi:hypothetical protein
MLGATNRVNDGVQSCCVTLEDGAAPAEKSDLVSRPARGGRTWRGQRATYD